ncbi:hypothetical protein PENSTE_c001G00730 [Penicillium steckii]|uniref:Carrier domain-containing protein n=1 Tax=Penicillium steckii TaxID=303698 RepID=A0A1V6U1P8_9EURO|nr:hypothetical protein PENSTE_c001G00730 [Penicillium steckii]
MSQLPEPIAIVGSGCRFAGGASSPSKLWDIVYHAQDVLQEIPPDRFNLKAFHHQDPQHPGKTNVRNAYLLTENVRHFDAQFFNLKAVEANAIDPQHRILLETVFEGIDSAGLKLEELKGSDTGVYVGLMYGDYENLQFRDLKNLPTYNATGTARSIVSNRISYFFDWNGPSMTIDTACSSSLVALHLAVQALRSGECKVAVAAGSNLLLGPEHFVSESKLSMLSPDGRSRMWDQGANGYARGEGVASVILKPLSAAIAAGDYIHCLVRETGVNQDGRSRGITMPSATAQADLIRSTYAKLDLNPLLPDERCQYFEAHGTGTKAGDPIEAEAIHRAFFGPPTGNKESKDSPRTPLYVGSVKTDIGHTESTAGLAGIIKATLALQHKIIPPNRLFEELNPDIDPFYGPLKIPQEPIPWPAVATGNPRRASVNSFGFGGTNGHVILESYETPVAPAAEKIHQTSSFSPFVFSAYSQQSLTANLKSYARYLEENPDINPADLAWTLQSRKSRLPMRVSFPASSIKDLQSTLSGIQDDSQNGTRPSRGSKEPRILGVFTGQGAQWARMGAGLIEKSPYASKILSDLEERLAELPKEDRPSWSLREQLLAKESRLGEAALAQPLCTAVQIVLVELLRLAGIQLSVVVGHSSGEIGAAFAAGLLSASDAICIAYYRGLHSHLAQGPEGIKGKMMAVGTTFEDAQELCALDEFQGRIVVAAVNSPTSVTLSGDADAVVEMAGICADEGKFHRQLKVDKAYHSHHMRPCSQAYMNSLRRVGVKVQTPTSDCVWVSSVNPEQSSDDGIDDLDATYWDRNLVSPVKFMQAVQKAIQLGPFDLAIEVGPHPALKGPVEEMLRDQNITLPYTGVLQRNTEATQSFSNALGLCWMHLDSLNLKIEHFESTMSGTNNKPRFIPNLPLYNWDHEREYWHESRHSRTYRTQGDHHHALLGDMTPERFPHQISWRNLLRPRELPWIHGHKIQEQTVFPAAGYVVTALEAAKFVAPAEKSIQLVEIEQFIIHQAVVFDNDDIDSSVEVLFNVSNIRQFENTRLRARFTYSACAKHQSTFQLIADGDLVITLGEPSQDVLLARSAESFDMVNVDKEAFYNSLSELGYGYTRHFQGLSGLQRKLHKAQGFVGLPDLELDEVPLVVHPATLDLAIQSIILAYSFPRDGEVWSVHVPVKIERIRVNPALCGQNWVEAKHLPFMSSVPDREEGTGFSGNVQIASADGNHAAIEVEGLRVVPFSSTTAADDKRLFNTIEWHNTEPIPEDIYSPPSSEETDLALLLERGSSFYLRQFEAEFPLTHPARKDDNHRAYLNYAAHVNNLVLQGKLPHARPEWLEDTLQDVIASTEKFSHLAEVKTMHTVGAQMPRVMRGETSLLEHLIENSLLDEYYSTAVGMSQVSDWIGEVVGQIGQRYPRMKILEIGAGTGGATKQVLPRLGDRFLSYTFTDISSGFFPTAQVEFEKYQDRMTYAVLDMEKGIKEQKFEPNSYDLVLASLVLHATKDLDATLRRARSLLRPGGFLVLLELTSSHVIRGPFIFGCFPGWWAGQQDGRVLSPCVPASRWDELLRNAGFSGVDTIVPEEDSAIFPNSVLVSQAVDDRVDFLREPLLSSPTIFKDRTVIENLFIIGGKSLNISRLTRDLQSLLKAQCSNITVLESFDAVTHTQLPSNTTVLILADLAGNTFQDITEERFTGLKRLFDSEKNILWVTQNRRVDDPFPNMAVGFARAAAWENLGLRFQFLDLENVRKPDPRALAEHLLRFVALGRWDASGQSSRAPLWSPETEVIINSEGKELVPRLRTLQNLNDRYNSARRDIEKEVKGAESVVTISSKNDQFFVRERANTLDISLSNAVKVTHSILHAVKSPIGYTFVALGENTKTGTQCLVLADSVSSVMDPREGIRMALQVPQGREESFIHLVAVNLLVLQVLKTTSPGDTILVYNIPATIALAFNQLAKEAGISIAYASSNQAEAKSRSWIFAHPSMYRSEIEALLPRDIARYIDFSNPVDIAHGPLRHYPPFGCAIDNTSNLFSTVGTGRYVQNGDSALLQQVVYMALAGLDIWEENLAQGVPATRSINDLNQDSESWNKLTTLTWSSPSIHVKVLPVEAMFKRDRTYWLVGFTGNMGRALCDWMILNGAKYIVLTARTPKVDPNWLAKAEQRGATIRIFSKQVVPALARDITDLQAVQECRQKIITELPPIAGIAHGAMVLTDGLTATASYSDLTAVLRPKVEGSLNLDQVFHDDKELDFFIFFSSVASVFGNPGQSAYAAANQFMSAITEQRRKRGCAASILYLGTVIGAGVVTREMNATEQLAMYDRGFMPMSEADVHVAFAEAVRASKPESKEQAQIITGLRSLPKASTSMSPSYSWPQFSDLTIPETEGNQSTSTSTGDISLKDRLIAATSDEEVLSIVSETFIAELRKVLQLPTESELTESHRSDELGLDSLISVRIRSWILTNYQVNIPALRILGGATIGELVEQTRSSIPSELIPNVGNGEKISKVPAPIPTPPPVSKAPVTNQIVATQDTQVAEKFSSSESQDPGSQTPSDLEDGISTPWSEISRPNKDEEKSLSELPLVRSGPLSYIQSMFWFVQELLPEKGTLNNTGIYKIRGEIRSADLARALEAVSQRHEALRTCFRVEDGRVIQGILPRSPLTLEEKKIHSEAELIREYEALRHHVYNLPNGQTIRIILVSGKSQSYLLMGYHHLVFDGASHLPFIEDLERAYSGKQLDNNVLQYLDFSNQQQSEYHSGQWKDDISFWRARFPTIPDPLPLHRSRLSERRPLSQYAAHTISIRIPKNISEQIREVARSYRATSFHVHVAAFKAILHRFLDVEDICIGVAEGSRREENMQKSIGPYLNIVPMRMKAESTQSFGRAIEQARLDTLQTLAHSHVPLEVILNELHVTRSPTHTPLFQVFLNYMEGVDERQRLGDCEMELSTHQSAKLAYDFSATIFNNAAGDASVDFTVQQGLYSETDAALIARGYEDVLYEIIQSPKRPSFNSEWPETLVHCFEKFLPAYSDNTAVTDSTGTSLSYGQLAQLIDTISLGLLEKDVTPGSRVAILQQASVNWIASLMAILKVGAVYVPLDPDTPTARLSLIVNDCKPAVILTDNQRDCQKDEFDPPIQGAVVNVSRLSLSPLKKPLEILARPQETAIILYTSGSTGTPKGVELRHESLKHEFDLCKAVYGLGQSDVVLQQSAYSFDLSVTQIFIALTVGAELRVVSHEFRSDARSIVNCIKNAGVTATYATPTEYKAWLRHSNQDILRSSPWRLSLTAGEAVTEPLLQLFRDLNCPQLRLFNVYGPTETTCGSTKMELEYHQPNFYDGRIPVGRAAANEAFYIMDTQRNIQPIGLPGEIFIAGVGVALGYLNNIELTKKAFHPDPFQPGSIMYQTGDRGRLLPDGSLLLEGRIQGGLEVKVNGVRIDLEDIEQTILKSANGKLANAAVSVRKFNDIQVMVAHVVSADNDDSGEEEVFLSKLLASLPLSRAMKPSAIIGISSLPTSVSGKLDRKLVEQLPISQDLSETRKPKVHSAGEARMEALWREVIPNELLGRIHSESDFFGCGGNSLLLIELQAQIREQLSIDIPLIELFQSSTLRSMVQLVEASSVDHDTFIDWEIETTPEIGLSAKSLSTMVNTPPRIVVLTGATGFLGQYILRDLVQQKNVERVICLAVRNANQRQNELLLSEISNGKVTVYEGDLQSARFGLDEETISDVFHMADVVIHNGADVSHLKTYASLRASNLHSTQELVRRCLPRAIPIHYISTTGVSMYAKWTNDTFPETSVLNSPPPRDGLHGYVSSKWASEVYLEKIHENYQLPIYIHRPSSIIRPEVEINGANPAPDVLQNLLSYSRRLHAVPITIGMHGVLDLVAPETVASNIVKDLIEKNSHGKVIFRHQATDLEIPFSGLKDHIQKETRHSIETISMEEWLSRAEGLGLSSAMVAVFRGVQELGIPFPKLKKGQ